MFRVITESTLTKSDVFNRFNDASMNSGGKTQTDKAIELIKSAKILTNEDIEGAYVEIKQITDTLTRAALKAFDNKEVMLVYNQDPKKSLMQALPFLTFKNCKTYVFVDKYCSIDRNGVMKIRSAILRDFLIAGTISNGIKKNYNNLLSNDDLKEICMNVYREMFFRIIHREYNVASDKQLSEKIQYFIAKFFLINVYGVLENSSSGSDNIEKLSMSHMHDGVLDDVSLEEIKNAYTNAHPSTVTELIDLIKTLSPRMNAFSMGIFLGNWYDYYYAPSLLAIDNIEYLIFTILTLASGNNIVNIAASDIVKNNKKYKILRGELLKLI